MKRLKLFGAVAAAALLTVTAVYAQQQLTPWKKVRNGTYTPPNMNGANPEHYCDRASGFCLPDEKLTCKQQWRDGNGNGIVDAGDRVRCKDNGNSAW